MGKKQKQEVVEQPESSEEFNTAEQYSEDGDSEHGASKLQGYDQASSSDGDSGLEGSDDDQENEMNLQ
jgi:hypothetical protein